ncbi:LamB/YcsF family protein [Savagea sp. SN6]|uniref:5-oxoprolinase subunit A n=1 Tax=Savagea serpentis TaxID=2785297 RepID=A0A8J7G7J0_9BACL|nr:5-oxoprolinase subunit PxpA [Savagea serpentis]MBF4500613.1 LamB/YcsF family protein [Savagea serpentis]
MKVIDLNCDLGESFGDYKMGLDEQVIPLISSANVACGFHAGDPNVMNDTVQTAKQHHVAVGAHIGYPDLVGFGRRNLDITNEQLRNDIIYQIGALRQFVELHGLTLQHVKPHGAMGNMAFVDERIARVIVETMLEVTPELYLYVLPGTAAHRIAEQSGLPFILEVFADRAYNDDLTLVSRKEEGAVIHEPERAAEHVLRMIQDGVVKTRTGAYVPIQAESICVHGDTAGAIHIVKSIRTLLQQEGIAIQSFQQREAVE